MSLALIVDDHTEALYLLRCVLEAERFQVIEARNGREALAALEMQSVDLVISDILMPVMDGFSLCRAMKANAQQRSIPFVFYTATYVDRQDEDFAMALGADLFLVKPAEPQVLMERVRALLAERRQQSPATAAGEPVSETPFLQQYNAVLIRKLEDKLEELEQTVRALRIKDFALASSGNGILLVRADGTVSYANPAFLRMTDKSETDVLEMPVRTLMAENATFARWLGDPHAAAIELPLVEAVSKTVWARVEKHTISDGAGAGLGSIVFCSDVTEERRLRDKIARIERLDALGLFAAGIAHDFNNLLMAVFSLMDADLFSSQQEREESHAMARAAFERARELTGRLLSFAKNGVGDRRPTDLRQLLDDTARLCLSGSGVVCEKQYSVDVPVANVDAGQMARVFTNLIVNARQAMHDAGTLQLAIDVARRKEDATPMVRVAIRDSGPGIAANVLPKIFEPYFTTKADGTGLGLATSQAIVQQHGGEIVARSVPGAGATFEIVLPLVRSDEARRAPPPVAIIGPPSNGRILVMDDQPSIQALLQQGLERIGYTVVVASNGEQALLEYRRAKNEARSFDLVLLDITVRGGMGGVDALEALRREDTDVLAIATTGYATDETTRQLETLGFARVLAKPFLIHELQATIRAVLGNTV